jgi:hypothetical protein
MRFPQTLLLAALLTAAAFGQSFKATLVGVVTDPQKDLIPGARVTLTSAATGERLTAVTDEDGGYSFQQVTPGAYQLRVEAQGFAAHVEENLTLEVAQSRRANIALRAGGVSEEVTVTAANAVTLNTEIGGKTEVMTTRQIEDLPLNGRNYLDLAKLLPGVMEAPDDTGKLNTNGTRSDATGYIQDGISNRIDRGAGQAVVTSPDTIQEFRVETSTYSAQYGRTAGAQIQVISKTGANRISGSLFEFARNDFFDAKDPFLLPTDSKKLNRHQFGGTVGGPLPLPTFGLGDHWLRPGKNKSFFFFSYDGFSERRSVNASTQAPHPDWLKGDFRNLRSAGADGVYGNADDIGRVLFPVVTFNAAGTPSTTRREFPTPNVIPAEMFSPVARKLLPYIPAANVPGVLIGYVSSAVNDINNRIMSVRIDQRLNERTNFFVRYAWTDNSNYNPSLGQARDFYPSFGGTTESNNRLLASGFTWVITPGVINELRFGANQTRQFIFSTYYGRDVNQELGITNVPVNPEVAGFPLIRIDGFPNFGDRDAWPNRFRAGNYQISDTLTWVKKGHSVKFGGEFFLTHYDENNYNSPRGNFRFRGRASNPANAVSSGPYSFSDFLLGYLHTVELGNVPKPSNFRNRQFSAYVQDDWNVTPRLTLNLGVRYDLLGPLTEKNNRISNYVPQVNKLICATEEIPPCVVDRSFPEALIKNDYNNFAPRLGFALRLGKGNKTVIRGGGGLFYSIGLLTLTRQQFATGYPFTNTLNYTVQTSPAYNPTSLRIDSALTTTPTAQGVNNPRGIAVNDPLGSVYQYNLTIERELAKDLVMEMSYVGSQGRHLGRRYNINPLVINKALIDFNRLNTQVDYVLPQIRRLTQMGLGTTIGNVTLGDIIYQENSGTSNYNSGQISFRRRARRGVIMQGAYSFSRSFDSASFVDAGTLGSSFQYPQNPDRLDLEYGLSDFDRTHRFTGSFVWDLPFGRGQWLFKRKGLGQKLFSGLQINSTLTLQTGRPFTPKLQTADFTGQRPDLLGDPLKDIPAGRYFNPFAFGDPSRVGSIERDDPNLYGTAGRGLLRGPAYHPVNVSLIKNFRIKENWRAQFRVEAFNVLNQPNFDLPDFTIETPLFNDALPKEERLRIAPNSAALTRILLPMRELQVALRLTF